MAENNNDTNKQQLPAETQRVIQQTRSLGLTPEKQQEVQRLIIQAVRETKYSGPLPSPTMLREYGTIVPDFPERIVANWESETKHRHAIENRLADSHIRLSERGQLIGLGLSLFFGLIGAYCVQIGQSLVANVIFATTIVALTTVFVVGRTADRQQDRDEGPPPPPKKKKDRR